MIGDVSVSVYGNLAESKVHAETKQQKPERKSTAKGEDVMMVYETG